MKVYLVSYDLNTPGKDYTKLIDQIRKFSGWFPVLKSQWFVCYNGTASDVYNKLAPCIDKNDRMFICEITSNRQGWLNQDGWDWLTQAGL